MFVTLMPGKFSLGATGTKVARSRGIILLSEWDLWGAIMEGDNCGHLPNSFRHSSTWIVSNNSQDHSGFHAMKC